MPHREILFGDIDAVNGTDLGQELYLAEPFLPAGGKAVLHGKRGHGKSALALTLMMSIARGDSFLQRYPCPIRGASAMIGIDMTPRLQQERSQKLRSAHPDVPAELLHFVMSDSRVDILDEAGSRQPSRWVEHLRTVDPVLVIIDTLRNTHKLDENVSETPGLVYDAWRHVVGPRATMMFLHHDRKSFATNGDGEDWRGAGAWFDEVDAGLHMIKTKRTGFRLEFSRVRTCDDQAPIPLELSVESLLLAPKDLPPVELEINHMMNTHRSREDILAVAMDHHRWNGGALSRATAFRRLDGYETSETTVRLGKQSHTP